MKTTALALATLLAVLLVGLIRYDGSLHPCEMMRQDLVRRYGAVLVAVYYDPMRPFMETRCCFDGWWELNFGTADWPQT